jgi:hypothetical protein
MIFSGSKGIFLVFMIQLSVYLFFRSKLLIWRILYLFFGIISLSWFASTDLFVNSFTNLDVSNQFRDNQSEEIIAEITLGGAGLGARLASGYNDLRDLPYALELTYHSILHKLGIVAGVALISFYLLPVILFFKRCASTFTIDDFLFFALSLHVVIAYGNPTLFSPSSCLIQMLLYARLYKSLLLFSSDTNKVAVHLGT